MAKSKIEWTGMTWNPVTGCTKISPGCMNCYAERMSKRLKAMGQKKYSNGFRLTLHEYTLQEPLRIKKPHNIFVNSMGDLFHKDVPLIFIQKVFNIMKKAHWHRFQILTKRSKRLLELSQDIEWPRNVWMGVTVENKDYLYRIDNLRKIEAFIKFISFEPLLSHIEEINLKDIDWVIVGGESGPAARVMDKNWVISIRDICLKEEVPFFFKQWGGMFKKKAGNLLENTRWEQYPDIYKIYVREGLINPNAVNIHSDEYYDQIVMNLK